MCSLSSYENEKTAGMRCSRRFCRLNVLATNLYQPTGNLDSKSGGEVMEMLQNIWKKMGKTIAVITHDSHIAEMADRQFTIVDGILSEVTVV